MSILKAVIRIEMPVSALAGADLDWPADNEAAQPPTISLTAKPLQLQNRIFQISPTHSKLLAYYAFFSA